MPEIEDAQSVAAMAQEFIAAGLTGAKIQRAIEWVDTDAAGHQHNSVIMRFVEAAESQLFRQAGLTTYFPIAPRVRHEVDFRAKLYFGQDVTVAVRVERVGTSSMTFAFKVWGHRLGERGVVLAAEGKFVTVCVPHGSEASAPWPREILESLAPTQAT